MLPSTYPEYNVHQFLLSLEGANNKGADQTARMR